MEIVTYHASSLWHTMQKIQSLDNRIPSLEGKKKKKIRRECVIPCDHSLGRGQPFCQRPTSLKASSALGYAHKVDKLRLCLAWGPQPRGESSLKSLPDRNPSYISFLHKERCTTAQCRRVVQYRERQREQGDFTGYQVLNGVYRMSAKSYCVVRAACELTADARWHQVFF